MEFRLIYQGPLPAEKCKGRGSAGGGAVGRAKDKHKLRKHFHLQLRELWDQHPNLRAQANAYCYLSDRGDQGKQFVFVDESIKASNVKKYIEHIADSHIRCTGNRFVPLISNAGGFTCSLHILFLRRDNPGNLIEDGGDIDNRIKVLLDGLRMPVDVRELGGLQIAPDEEPFFCLLEDDSLITSVTVITDRLLVPQQREENIHDVYLVIHVTVVNPSALFAGGRLV